MLKYNKRTCEGEMTKDQRNPKVQAPRRNRRLRLSPLLPRLAIEHLKTPEYTSIHMLKTFLISKSLPVVRGGASRSCIEIEVVMVALVTNENTGKYAFVCVCARIFRGGIKNYQCPMTKDQRNPNVQGLVNDTIIYAMDAK